jgi:hypothetical protein
MERTHTKRAIVLAIAILLAITSCYDFFPKFPMGTVSKDKTNVQFTPVSDNIQEMSTSVFVSYTAVVISDGLNVRSCPSTDCATIYQKSKGDIVTVYQDGIEAADSLCWEWAKIENALFVCQRFLK